MCIFLPYRRFPRVTDRESTRRFPRSIFGSRFSILTVHSLTKHITQCQKLRRRIAIQGFEEEESFHRRIRKITMTAVKIIGALVASGVVAYVCDNLIADQKIFGGTTPSTITNKEWAEATEKRLQAWPRTAGPPVVMNPISRQNFIVKPQSD